MAFENSIVWADGMVITRPATRQYFKENLNYLKGRGRGSFEGSEFVSQDKIDVSLPYNVKNSLGCLAETERFVVKLPFDGSAEEEARHLPALGLAGLHPVAYSGLEKSALIFSFWEDLFGATAYPAAKIVCVPVPRSDFFEFEAGVNDELEITNHSAATVGPPPIPASFTINMTPGIYRSSSEVCLELATQLGTWTNYTDAFCVSFTSGHFVIADKNGHTFRITFTNAAQKGFAELMRFGPDDSYLGASFYNSEIFDIEGAETLVYVFGNGGDPVLNSRITADGHVCLGTFRDSGTRVTALGCSAKFYTNMPRWPSSDGVNVYNEKSVAISGAPAAATLGTSTIAKKVLCPGVNASSMRKDSAAGLPGRWSASEQRDELLANTNLPTGVPVLFATVTIPAGEGGLYAICATANVNVSLASNIRDVEVYTDIDPLKSLLFDYQASVLPGSIPTPAYGGAQPFSLVFYHYLPEGTVLNAYVKATITWPGAPPVPGPALLAGSYLHCEWIGQ